MSDFTTMESICFWRMIAYYYKHLYICYVWLLYQSITVARPPVERERIEQLIEQDFSALGSIPQLYQHTSESELFFSALWWNCLTGAEVNAQSLSAKYISIWISQ